MKLPKPNIEWHCVVPAPLNDKSYEKLLDDLGKAHEIFAKTVGLNGAPPRPLTSLSCVAVAH